MRLPILTLSLFVAMTVRADDWELSVFQTNQKIPAAGGFQSATFEPHGFRVGYSVRDLGPVDLRLEGTWTPRTTADLEALDPIYGMVLSVTRGEYRSEGLSLRAESWFVQRFFCLSAALEERLTHVDYSPLNGSAVAGFGSNRLPQTWVRVGVGARVWFFGLADLGRGQDSSWYPLLRLEWAAAVSPKGHGAAADLLPRQEVAFSAGFRF